MAAPWGRNVSLHIGAVLLEENHLLRLSEIYKEFQFAADDSMKTFTDLKAVAEAIERGASTRDDTLGAACFTNGWTFLLDTDLTLSADDEVCSRLSALLDCRIFTMVCEGVSNTYGWSLYSGGRKSRGFLSEDGVVKENFGEPLSAEAGIDLTDVFEDEVLAVMKATAVDFGDFWETSQILVGELTFVGPAVELTPEVQARLGAEVEKLAQRVTVVRGNGQYSKATRKRARTDAAREAERKSRWKFWRR